MATLSVELSDVLYTSVMEIVPGRFASVDWFVERTLLDRVGALRTEETAPPRMTATAHRIAGAIILTAGLHALGHELVLKDTMRAIPDSDSDTVLGNALLKILALSTRDTTAFGQDAVDAGPRAAVQGRRRPQRAGVLEGQRSRRRRARIGR
jgi:hypothetical protein